MSASLVGSEMCIRDRARKRRRSSTELCTCPAVAPRRASCLPTPRVAPVSYTHLTLPTICSV
eukprot:11194945-Alexandrium_andersonii.AAC.1